MSKIHLVVLGEPVAKARSRTCRTERGTSYSYTPSKTASAEESIRWHWVQAGRPRLEGPLRLAVTFYMPRRKATPKKAHYHVKRPDIDNLLKTVLDALCPPRSGGFAYGDDSQIVEVHATKVYAPEGTNTQTIIFIHEVEK